ncbi:hypothetical protein CR513_58735, partial [Mucuna pruriens]
MQALKCRKEVLVGAHIGVADGRASITASAKSVMKEGVTPRAGTRAQFLTPDSRANSLYSMSISSRVSICSLTKLGYMKTGYFYSQGWLFTTFNSTVTSNKM